ncbi:hypothetical protein SUGI_0298170 [Cryptomeria japonica]|nr:hypothetical protein SUGI_0298170 [Cryptomeria japonica]
MQQWCVEIAIVTREAWDLLFPDPVSGPHRNFTYREAVKAILDDRRAWVCGLIQYLGLCGTCIAYTITASISMRYFVSLCLLSLKIGF